MSQWIHCCPFFSYFPLNRLLEWRAGRGGEAIPGDVRLIQIRLYSFCEKGHHFVKTNSQRLPKSSGVAGYICSEPGVVPTLTPRLVIPVTVFPLARVTQRFFSKLGSPHKGSQHGVNFE